MTNDALQSALADPLVQTRSQMSEAVALYVDAVIDRVTKIAAANERRLIDRIKELEAKHDGLLERMEWLEFKVRELEGYREE